MIRKKQRKMFEQPRLRSQSQDLYDSPDFQQQMKCNQTLQELNYFTSNLESNQQLDQDKCTCRCTKCQGFITNIDNDIDPDLKKRLKRRQYKKRQKLKAQQKKQQALKQLSLVIADIYQLKTDFATERPKIQQWLKAIEKNVNRFYEFINAVIRQQVESIKKELRICLSQLATAQPNFSKVPRLYEQFMKVKDASPEVQKIINSFIDIISERSHQPTKYQKDLDKKTFRFLLISDTQNRNAFLQVIKLIEQGNIKHQRQKQMLRMIIQMIKQKKISSECSSSEQGSQGEYSDNEEQEYEESQGHAENTTKASEQEEQCSECFEEQYDQEENDNECQNEKQNNNHHNVNGHSHRHNHRHNHSNNHSHTHNNAHNNTHNHTHHSPNQHHNNNSRQQQQTKVSSSNNNNGMMKRRRKNKNIKLYEPSFEKTYETLVQLEKTLGVKKDERLQCNVDEQWLQRLRDRMREKMREGMRSKGKGKEDNKKENKGNRDKKK